MDVPPATDRPRRTVTYETLEGQANRLASRLVAHVRDESVIAIVLPRDSHLYITAQLAVLKAGAAYTAIDPAFPDERIRFILEDCRASVLVTDRDGISRLSPLPGCPGTVVDAASAVRDTPSANRDATSAVQDGAARPGCSEPPRRTGPESLAYVTYTSGTTGRPKGVMIEHRGVANLVAADLEAFRLSPGDRVVQGSSASYDSSVEELWLGLAAGATVVVMDDEAARLGPDLVDWLRREGATVFCPPPTQLRAMGEVDPSESLPDLSLVYVGGEALPEDVADRWASGCRLVNGYGPTEGTITAIRGRIREGGEITIGKPVRNVAARVVDADLESVPDGETGELVLGGIGLARGYRNRDALTAEKFPEHPQFGRIFRTGDLVHRSDDGNFFYYGRIDRQVKIRGYRVELEEIESLLLRCDGVRQAACRVRGEGARQTLEAFLVPEDPESPPPHDRIRDSLTEALPSYMIPNRFATLAALPVTVGGKLDRDALPAPAEPTRAERETTDAPPDGMEQRIESAFREVLGLRETIPPDADFFHDLGGTSLTAAMVVSLLRNDPLTAGIAVRDLYEARTPEALARLARSEEPGTELTDEDHEESGSPVLATVIQAAWLLAGLVAGAGLAYLLAFEALPRVTRTLGLTTVLLIGPALFFLASWVWACLALLLAVTVKTVLIGRYRPLRAPLWGSFHRRNWMVTQVVRLVPWALLEGTVFQQFALRALGARIGSRVHIHRGVDLLQGGWDLLEIGDDVTLSQDSALRLVDLEKGRLVAGPVTLGNGATLEVRAGVAPGTALEPGAVLTHLSHLPQGGRIPAGERWSGVPAEPAGLASPPPVLTRDERSHSPFRHAVLLVIARFVLQTAQALPMQALLLSLALLSGTGADRALDWAFGAHNDEAFLAVVALLVVLAGPITLAARSLLLRSLGPLSSGVISRWGLSYVRVLLKTELLQAAGRQLSGTLFWPLWLRLSGMKVGRGSEISTIIDTIPELVRIGPSSFLADGIYLGGPRIRKGRVILERTVLGENTFVGNHAVIPCGRRLPGNGLLGICTVAEEGFNRSGTSWFGIPPFELPRREVVECDRRLTHDPSPIRWLNRFLWEAMRFALPLAPLAALLLWLGTVNVIEDAAPASFFYPLLLPLTTLGAAGALCLLTVILKWALLGRVRPGRHPFWSCWCSRWDFLYVAWQAWARPALAFLEGTLLLNLFLRIMGVRVGRRVALGSGFAQVVDPDMLAFHDGATVNGLFQAHSFEDRVLKIDRVTIREGASVGRAAVLLYGADVGAGARVSPHSVVMKHERLVAGRSYQGAPTKPSVRKSRTPYRLR